MKTYALNFAVGLAATMTGVSILKSITGSGSNNAGASAGDQVYQSPSYTSGSQIVQTPSSSSQSSTNTQASGPNQYQSQRRAVSHSKRADIFGEPNLSHGL